MQIAFQQKTWTDESICAEDLNRLEDRVEELRKVYDNVFDTLPTWQQAKDILDAGIIPALRYKDSDETGFDYIIGYDYHEPLRITNGGTDDSFYSYYTFFGTAYMSDSPTGPMKVVGPYSGGIPVDRGGSAS